MRHALVLLALPWFFVTAYGDVGVHRFGDLVTCDSARKRVIAMLTPLGASVVKRVDPQCTHDPAPPKVFELIIPGDLRIDGTWESVK